MRRSCARPAAVSVTRLRRPWSESGVRSTKPGPASSPTAATTSLRSTRQRRPRSAWLDGPNSCSAASETEGVRTQDVHGNVLVDLDGDHAKATAGRLVHFLRDGEPLHRSSGLRIACAATRTPAGRRFGEMTAAPAWSREQ
jgi:hypothetical protein